MIHSQLPTGVVSGVEFLPTKMWIVPCASLPPRLPELLSLMTLRRKPASLLPYPHLGFCLLVTLEYDRQECAMECENWLFILWILQHSECFLLSSEFSILTWGPSIGTVRKLDLPGTVPTTRTHANVVLGGWWDVPFIFWLGEVCYDNLWKALFSTYWLWSSKLSMHQGMFSMSIS